MQFIFHHSHCDARCLCHHRSRQTTANLRWGHPSVPLFNFKLNIGVCSVWIFVCLITSTIATPFLTGVTRYGHYSEDGSEMRSDIIGQNHSIVLTLPMLHGIVPAGQEAQRAEMLNLNDDEQQTLFRWQRNVYPSAGLQWSMWWRRARWIVYYYSKEIGKKNTRRWSWLPSQDAEDTEQKMNRQCNGEQTWVSAEEKIIQAHRNAASILPVVPSSSILLATPVTLLVMSICVCTYVEYCDVFVSRDFTIPNNSNLEVRTKNMLQFVPLQAILLWKQFYHLSTLQYTNICMHVVWPLDGTRSIVVWKTLRRRQRK